LCMDLHAQQIQGFFDIPVDHLYAFPVISSYIKEKNLSNLVVVSPDAGGVRTAYAYSQKLGAGLAIVAKKRVSATEVESFSLVGDVAGCNTVMVDDLTTTAGTFSSAARVLKEHGAKSVYAAVTHAAIVEVGVERLKKAPIEELIVTDTVPMIDAKGLNVKVLSVAGILGEAILRIHEDRSVNTLF
jgi:ribose-phosphate pyrophosphokinase